jgi:hypothetical protein
VLRFLFRKILVLRLEMLLHGLKSERLKKRWMNE